MENTFVWICGLHSVHGRFAAAVISCHLSLCHEKAVSLLIVCSCLIEYWKHGSWLGAISCPLCRQKVILLYNISCENQPDKQSKQTVYDIRDYNKRFSGQSRPFTDYLYDMPFLLNLAIRGLFTLGGLVWIFFLRVVVCSFGTIMCLTSPFDVMPEPLCGILGTVDDLVVVFLLLICMINICSQMESEGAHMTNSTTQNILLES